MRCSMHPVAATLDLRGKFILHQSMNQDMIHWVFFARNLPYSRDIFNARKNLLLAFQSLAPRSVESITLHNVMQSYKSSRLHEEEIQVPCVKKTQNSHRSITAGRAQASWYVMQSNLRTCPPTTRLKSLLDMSYPIAIAVAEVFQDR